MKLREIIARLDKSKNNEDYVSLDDLASELSLEGFFHSENERIKSYWICRHLCTDTHVGVKAYFLDGELVCVSSQSARKSPEVFEWVSENTIKIVREYLLSLLGEDNYCGLYMLNLDRECGDHYELHYAEQFIKKDVIWNDKPAKIVGRNTMVYDRTTPTVQIEQGGNEFWVLPNEIKTPLNIV
jgi:hypothetical protein